ncbi:MAG: hypothetical protein KDD42_10110, partial [Bdellovibrionales bacterium]|nr:hypothetical protein [Bdellovibrionales bacterium]
NHDYTDGGTKYVSVRRVAELTGSLEKDGESRRSSANQQPQLQEPEIVPTAPSIPKRTSKAESTRPKSTKRDKPVSHRTKNKDQIEKTDGIRTGYEDLLVRIADPVLPLSAVVEAMSRLPAWSVELEKQRLAVTVLSQAPGRRAELCDLYQERGWKQKDSTRDIDAIDLLDDNKFLSESEARGMLGQDYIRKLSAENRIPEITVSIGNITFFKRLPVVRLIAVERLIRMLDQDLSSKHGLATALNVSEETLTDAISNWQASNQQPISPIAISQIPEFIQNQFPNAWPTIRELLLIKTTNSFDAAKAFGWEPLSEDYGSEWYLSTWEDKDIGRVRIGDEVRYLTNNLRAILDSTANKLTKIRNKARSEKLRMAS